MIRFKGFINEAAANTHMQHLEQLVFDLGVEGTRRAIFFLRDVRDMLSAGNTNKQAITTVKWDGCVHEDTVILTNAGDMTIKQIVEREDLWGELEIYGRNMNSQIFPYDGSSLLIAGNSSEGEKPWVELALEDGSTIKLTHDHEVHTSNRGWVKAGELQEGDDITEMGS